MFQAGDKVKVKNQDPNRITDYEADLLMNILDGTCTYKKMDKIMNAIKQGKYWEIVSISDFGYELRLGKIDAGLCFEDKDLEF